MKLKTKIALVGVAGLVVVAGTVVAVRAIKQRAKHVLSRKIRRSLGDIVRMSHEDFVNKDALGKSVFMHYVDKLDTKQLIALCALVQVGYFIKVSGINPLHASKAEIEQAARKYLIEQSLAPITRDDLITSLDNTDTHDALKAAYGILG